MALHWQWLKFSELSLDQLYQILAAREAVFVLEQTCNYQDADGLDQYAYHLLGLADDKTLMAYARIVFPGKKYASEPAIGRVLTVKAARSKGYGRDLIKQALNYIDRTFPGSSMRLSAQLYLEHFYQTFGFKTVSEPYDEEGIEHIEMLLER